MEDLTHNTYIKDDGLEASITVPEEYFRTNGAFLRGVDGIEIAAADTSAVLPEGDLFVEAMVAGPILIDDGILIEYSEDIAGWDSFYNHVHPRSLIGTDAKGFIWLVTVDGRTSEQAVGMTVQELTDLALSLGLTDALNLDGGGSTTLWTRTEGVLNNPSDNQRMDHEGQRVVPSVLAVWKR